MIDEVNDQMWITMMIIFVNPRDSHYIEPFSNCLTFYNKDMTITNFSSISIEKFHYIIPEDTTIEY